MPPKNLKIMGIIGIRAGSKTLPDKNIKLLDGIPLVGHILGTANNSKYINRLLVSTDSEEYAKIAIRYGAEIPCLRPESLATDLSPDFDYVEHMLEWLWKHEKYSPDIIVRMLATSPLQKIDDIDKAIEILIKDKNSDSVVIVSEMRQHPLKALKIVEDYYLGKRLVSYFGASGREVSPTARQNYEKAYVRANVIVCRNKTILETNSLTGDNVKYHIIPQEESIDIDSKIDFDIAEFLIKQQKKKSRAQKKYRWFYKQDKK